MGVASAVQLRPLCSPCQLRGICLPSVACNGESDALDSLIFQRNRIKAGQTLYGEGDAFRFIYAVRMGTFKSSISLADGREQISGFHMTGEMLGLDGFANGTHASSATALEDSEICVIPYLRLAEATAPHAATRDIFSRLMSREIVREHSLMLLLGSMNAEERLAAFLLNLSRRLAARGYSATEFHLRMSRAEIGSYLGMTLETVSRTFSHFQHKRILDVAKRHIRIIDLERLSSVIETSLH
jgi:CRP/FNR family transcriptional regulator